MKRIEELEWFEVIILGIVILVLIGALIIAGATLYDFFKPIAPYITGK
jgi:hypothetical protein